MEILEITGSSYPTAIELPNKTGRPINKRQGSPGGNSGSGKTRTHYVPRPAGRMLTDLQIADREATAAGKRVMIILGGGKRKLIRNDDYLAGNF